jgi:hypothetical protein
MVFGMRKKALILIRGPEDMIRPVCRGLSELTDREGFVLLDVIRIGAGPTAASDAKNQLKRAFINSRPAVAVAGDLKRPQDWTKHIAIARAHGDIETVVVAIDASDSPDHRLSGDADVWCSQEDAVKTVSRILSV